MQHTEEPMSEPTDPVYNALLTLLGVIERSYRGCPDRRTRAQLCRAVAEGLEEAMAKWETWEKEDG